MDMDGWTGEENEVLGAFLHSISLTHALDGELEEWKGRHGR